MKIGIIGIGAITLDFGVRALSAGHEILLNSPAGHTHYRDIITRLGANAKLASTKEAARAEIVILFLPWDSLRPTLRKLPDMTGKLVLHTNNALFNPESFAEYPTSSCELIAEKLPTADIVKVFNVMTPRASSDLQRHEIYFSAGSLTAHNNAITFLETLNFSGIDISSKHSANLPN